MGRLPAQRAAPGGRRREGCEGGGNQVRGGAGQVRAGHRHRFDRRARRARCRSHAAESARSRDLVAQVAAAQPGQRGAGTRCNDLPHGSERLQGGRVRARARALGVPVAGLLRSELRRRRDGVGRLGRVGPDGGRLVQRQRRTTRAPCRLAQAPARLDHVTHAHQERCADAASLHPELWPGCAHQEPGVRAEAIPAVREPQAQRFRFFAAGRGPAGLACG